MQDSALAGRMNNDNDDFYLFIWNPILCIWIEP